MRLFAAPRALLAPAVMAVLFAADVSAAFAPQTPPPPVRVRSIPLRGVVVPGRATGPGSAGPVAPMSVQRTAAGEMVLVQDPQPGAPTVAAPAAQPVDPAVQAQQQLLQLVLKTKFDRRPSEVLAAWARPELKPYDPEEEKKEQAEGAPAEAAAAPAAGPEVTIPDPVIPEGMPEAEAQQLRDAVAAQREAASKAKAAAEKQKVAAKERARRIEMLQRDVTLSRWDAVAAFFEEVAEKDRKKVYEHLLGQLSATPPDPKNRNVPPQLHEKNAMTFEDVLTLAGLAPGGFDKKQVARLVPLLNLAIAQGNVLEVWIERCKQEVSRPEAEQRIDRRECALILAALGKDIEMGPFLPTVAVATESNDREAFNLLARYHMAQHAVDQKADHLVEAWNATQAALAVGEIEDEDKAEALRRAVELVPQLGTELGTEWLVQSFTERPERGMEIVATIGSQAARGFQEQPRNAKERQLALTLQKAAIDALFMVAPQLADEWRPTLQLLAGNWLSEATWSYSNSQTTTLRPYMRRDAFGNMFYEQRSYNGNGPITAIEPAELLAARPTGNWEAMLDASIKPHLSTTTARLLLKVDEDAQAFPYIEELATVNPRICKELADEFLRVWMRNHDPNRSNTDAYMFMYGFDRRSNGIPLTRSKQDRNLEDLAFWVAKLRALPIEEGVDEQLLGQAFRTAHSSAEVYRLETIQSVFGDLSELEPKMLSQLLDTMRTNLATTWRRPDVQEQAGTKRSQKDIAKEVSEGYLTAMTVAEKAMRQHERHWALQVAQAAIGHDFNNFMNELQRSTDFAENRRKAFAAFAAAADDYLERVENMRLNEESTRVFELWFYAALGACDLGAIDESMVLDESQLPVIQEYLTSMPEPQGKRHMDRFANLIFTRMSAVRPQIKWRYLDAAFKIVGDHPQAYEAKKVFDYYKDLTKEIQLVARVDGAADVGTEPFGVMIDLEHTVQIERESGGFAKYLQNQNNMQYAYNYGRPTENYRDKFHDAVIQALDENFDVMSVTFNAETVNSISIDRPGWRKTPYAYALLKARGAQIDRIPPVKIDLDFLDTSGYVILPITSSPVVIDASRKADEPRPFEELSITQVLDERKADDGKLILEIKAECKGLVPDLDRIATAEFAGFEVDKVDDQNVSVSKFDESQQAVRSERLWLLTLKAKEGAPRPETFRFAEVIDSATPVYQRYEDADLATVTRDIELRNTYGDGAAWWPWILLLVVLVAGVTWLLLARKAPVDPEAGANLIRMPAQLTPFSVLALLRQIETSGRINGESAQLREAIVGIEEHYFARGEGQGPDLQRLAEEWLRRAS